MGLANFETVTQPAIREIGTFLTATAEVLRETIMRFEKTTAQITGNLMTRPDQADRDLIVTLQDFDRLQQEFLMFAEVLTQAAGKSGEFLVARGRWRSSGRGRDCRDFGCGSQGTADAPTEYVDDHIGAGGRRRGGILRTVILRARGQDGDMLDDATQTFGQFRNLLGSQPAIGFLPGEHESVHMAGD